MSTDEHTDGRWSRLRARLLALLPAPGESTDPSPRDEALALIDELAAESRAQQAASQEMNARLNEISDMLLGLVAFDYSRQAPISGKDDILDGFAFGLNMLSEELSQSTVSKEYVTNIIESLTDALIVTDPAGTVKTVNQAAMGLTGYAQGELLDRPLDLLFSDITLRGVLASGGFSGQELSLARRGGGSVWVSLSVSVMRHKGELAGFVCVARDLTETKVAEQERMRLHEAVQRQSIILEELSTPLMPIAEDVLVLPLIGSLDEHRANSMTAALLESVVSHKARVVIVDITGVRSVGAEAVDALIRAVNAVRLVGAEVVLTGLRPDIAATITSLDVDLRRVVTLGSLQRGIQYAMEGRRGRR